MNDCNVSNSVLVSALEYKATKHLVARLLRARPGDGYGSGAVITFMRVVSRED